MTRSVFRLDGSEEEAQRYVKVLAAANYGIDKVMKSKSRTACSPGSEFRIPEVLDAFMSKHKNWEHVRKIKYNDVDQEEENAALIEYNNKKGARENIELVSNAINEDVNRGFAIVLQVGSKKLIPG
jgi:hypothetical protein